MNVGTISRLLPLALVTVELLELHGPDGQRMFVNTAQISSLREPTQNDMARHFPRGTRCVLVTTNGKFMAVTEPCNTIRDLLQRTR